MNKLEEKEDTPKVQKKSPSEFEQLVKEKIELSTKLGIMGKFEPKDGYQETDEYKRINGIDQRLWELVK